MRHVGCEGSIEIRTVYRKKCGCNVHLLCIRCGTVLDTHDKRVSLLVQTVLNNQD